MFLHWENDKCECINANQANTKSNPNTNPTTKQHATVNIQLNNHMSCVSNNVVARFLPLSVVIVTRHFAGCQQGDGVSRWRMYVGGQPQRLNSVSSELSTSASSIMSGFVGCLSNLYVNDWRLQLARAAVGQAGVNACAYS